MRIFEIGTGYTSIPANKGAATEIMAENLSRSLIALGHDVTVVDIADSNRLPTDLPIAEVPMPRGLKGTDEALGVKHKIKRVVYSISLARKLHSLLMQESESVVLHFHNQYNAYFFYKTRALLGVPHPAVVCYTNHSWVWNTQEWENIEKTIRRRYFQEMYSQARADAVFVLNENTQRHVHKRCGTPKERVFRIKNGVDTNTYMPIPDEQARSVKVSIAPSCEKLIFQCASVYPNKNQLGAVRLLAPILLRDPSVHYAYAGGIVDAGYQAKLAEAAASLGVPNQVHYLGEINPGIALNKYYAAAEAFILPSKYEGFSMALVEAMAAGTPSFVDANAGIVPLGSETDGFFMYQDADHFMELMVDVLYSSDLQKSASEAARALAVETYSWDRVARDYADVMEQVLCT